MEDGMDIEESLISKFSSMGTEDKDILISEFRKLLGFQLNAAGCEFFLDMTNWNLHAAIGAYYDFEAPATKTPSMAFVSDVTIGEGEGIPPDTEFIKTWRLCNSGDERWPMGCTLRHVNGDRMGSAAWVAIAELFPNQKIEISVKMKSPPLPGIYQGQWRLYTKNMVPFGDAIWVIITVEHGGILGMTQQFVSALGNPDSSVFPAAAPSNPFSLNGDEEMDSNVAYDNQPGFGSLNTNHNNLMDGHRSHFLSSPVNHRITVTPASPPLSPTTCWETRSPTAVVDSNIELSSAPTHSLQSINEEEASESTNPSFLLSNSSYDLNARQVSPFSSPTKFIELERSFTSPDAPSPIKPTSNHNFQNPSKAVHHLDFSSGS